MADPRPRPPVELLWPGKYAPDGRRAVDLPRPAPALRPVARHGPDAGDPGLLVEGDSADVAAALLPAYRARADLVYLDPPFDTGDDFRLPDGSVAYADRWEQPGDYLAFLDRRLADAHALLADRGTLWLHLDHRRVHHARALLDEHFGATCWRNEVIWHYQTGGRTERAFARKHDTLLVYGRTPRPHFDAEAVRVPRGARRSHLRRGVDPDGRAYGEVTSAGKVYRYYDDEGVVPDDVWADISALNQRDPERTGYPTQKPLALLDRIVRASCPPGGLVVDLGCGSGTALVAAARLGRRFLGADRNPAALALASARLLALPSPPAFEHRRVEPPDPRPVASGDAASLRCKPVRRGRCPPEEAGPAVGGCRVTAGLAGCYMNPPPLAGPPPACPSMFASHRRTALPHDRAWLSTRALVHTGYRVHLVDNGGVVSDDRLMLRAYDRKGATSRPVVTVVIEGEARIEACGRVEWLAPGDVSVVEQKHLIRMRQGRQSGPFRSLVLEWEPGTLAPARPAGFVVHRARCDGHALAGPGCPLALGERATGVLEGWLRATLAALRDAGLGFSPDAELVEPVDDSTRRLGLALDDLLSDLRARPMAVDLFDQVGLSLRQINRRVIDFNQRYGFNALGWRDALNRRRLMLGAALLTCPGVTVTEVSDAIGFSSPNAFTRALSEAGFPPPSQVARLVAGFDP